MTFLTLTVFAFVLIYYVIPFIINKAAKASFKKEMRNKDGIYLSFDDGPDPETTRQVLNILKQHNKKAIFFLIGSKAEKHINIVQQIIHEGHIIGEHSYSHYHPWKLNIFKYANDIYRSYFCFKSIRKKLNINSNLYRPPHGKYNILTLLYILLTRKKVIFWNIDSKDYCQEEDAIIEKTMKELSDGQLLLFHDSNANPNHGDKITSVIDKIIPLIESKNRVIKNAKELV